ncbi:MAG: hypothetical protein LBS64_05910 [Spirochaetaceae bacterium]|jgi:hypothetical protein|nr:hypothetical protein [Spirochaetaceae bacterium]
MRKVLFGLAAILLAAMVFTGCDNGSGGTTEVNSYFVADDAALQLLLAEKKSPIILAANIGVTGSVIIPAGVTLQVPAGKTLSVSAVLGGAGTLTGAGAVSAATVALQNVPPNVIATTKVAVAKDLADAQAETKTEVAVLDLNASDLANDSLGSGKTLYVLGTLTLGTTAPALSSDGKVVALGTVAVSGTVDASAYLAITDTADKINTAGAALKTTGDTTLKLPADNSATFAAIDVSDGDLTINTGAVTFSSLTVGSGKEFESDTLTVTGPVTSAGTLKVTSSGALVPTTDAVVTIGQGGIFADTSARAEALGTITGGPGGGTLSLSLSVTTMTVGGNLTLDGGKLPSGQTLNVTPGATITAKNFAPLGTLNVAGAIIVPDAGTLTIATTATGTVTGTITAKSGSTITYTPSTPFEFGPASGSLVLEADSDATISGLTVKNDDDATGFKLASGTITWKKDAIEFAGTVTQKIAEFPGSDAVIIKSGTYTIPANTKLKLMGRNLVVHSGASIIGEAATSLIELDSTVGNNFYVTDGAGTGDASKFPEGSHSVKQNYKWKTDDSTWEVAT